MSAFKKMSLRQKLTSLIAFSVLPLSGWMANNHFVTKPAQVIITKRDAEIEQLNNLIQIQEPVQPTDAETELLLAIGKLLEDLAKVAKNPIVRDFVSCLAKCLGKEYVDSLMVSGQATDDTAAKFEITKLSEKEKQALMKLDNSIEELSRSQESQAVRHKMACMYKCLAKGGIKLLLKF